MAERNHRSRRPQEKVARRGGYDKEIVVARKRITSLQRTIHLASASRYRPGVAQRVGRGIALLFLDRGTRRR